MIDKPTCLHIPAIYEESFAFINWEMVDDALGYELDLHFDEDFQSALTGKIWDNLDSENLIWEEIEQKLIDWNNFENLLAQGLDWSYFNFLDMDWNKTEEKIVSWQDFQKVVPKFTVFRGEGIKVQAPDQGLVWEDLNSSKDYWSDFEIREWSWEDFELQLSKGQSWYQLENKQSSWDKIEGDLTSWYDIEILSPYGLCWGSIEGIWTDWEVRDGHNLTWQEIEELPPDTKTHVGNMVEIPIYKKKVILRVRAYSDSDFSDYITTALIDTLPRSLAKYKPPCLHIPKLYEDGDADIVWGDLYGAEKFVLERRLGTKEFEVIYHGEGITVKDQFNKKKCETLSKISDVSTHFHFVDHVPLYEKTVTYRVRAYNTTDSSQYLISKEIKTLPRSLAKYKPPCLHIPELHEGKNADIVWGDLYGAEKFVLERKLANRGFVSLFDNSGVPVKDPNNKQNCDVLSKLKDVDTHFHFVDSIPYKEKTAVYRVKAYNTTDHSQYLESKTITIIPVFYREDAKALNVEEGKKYLVQIHARNIDEIADVVLSLCYDHNILELENIESQSPTNRTDMLGKKYDGNIREKSNLPGKLNFSLRFETQENKKHDGLIGLISFKALKSGNAEIALS